MASLQACDLDTGTLKSSTSTVILYVARLCCRLENYVSFVLAYEEGTHDCICGQPFRGLRCAPGVAARLRVAQKQFRHLLWGEMTKLIQAWYHKLVKECDSSDDDQVLDTNTKHMCSLHAHLLLTLRNVPTTALTESRVTTVVTAVVFLSTRHEWNMSLLDRKDGVSSYGGWRIPETEIYEVVHVLRRKVVTWLHERADQRQLDLVMDSVVRVSASTGALKPTSDEVPHRWAYVAGEHNLGRFALHSSRSKTQQQLSSAAAAAAVPTTAPGLSRQASDASAPALSRHPSAAAEHAPAPPIVSRSSVVPGVVQSVSAATPAEEPERIVMMADSELAVEVDAQLMQLTLRASHPQALPTDVARLKDVVDIFGEVSMQACLTEQSTWRSCYRLVGRSHDIEHWPNKDPKLPLLDHHRAYYPDELYPSEKIWLPSVFEPVRRTYLLFPRPLEVYLPEEPLAEDAQVSALDVPLIALMAPDEPLHEDPDCPDGP